MALDQALRTIRNRIDQFGVAEPDIRKQAGNRIQVQLPGISDPRRAVQIIGQTAHLEFHLVRDDVDPGQGRAAHGRGFPAPAGKHAGRPEEGKPDRRGKGRHAHRRGCGRRPARL